MSQDSKLITNYVAQLIIAHMQLNVKCVVVESIWLIWDPPSRHDPTINHCMQREEESLGRGPTQSVNCSLVIYSE